MIQRRQENNAVFDIFQNFTAFLSNWVADFAADHKDNRGVIFHNFGHGARQFAEPFVADNASQRGNDFFIRQVDAAFFIIDVFIVK